MNERQELYCHECMKNVQFDLDVEFDGNHEIKCPNCGHIHYRVVRDGQVTDERYNSSYGVVTVTATSTSSSTMSPYYTYATTSTTLTSSGVATPLTGILYSSWSNKTS